MHKSKCSKSKKCRNCRELIKSKTTKQVSKVQQVQGVQYVQEVQLVQEVQYVKGTQQVQEIESSLRSEASPRSAAKPRSVASPIIAACPNVAASPSAAASPKNNIRQPTTKEPKQESEPVPETLTSKPWRQPADWNKELEEKIKEDIKKFNPMNNPYKRSNILLLGPAGGGKSSFINSVLSIGKGRKCELAMVSGSGVTSWTLDVARYTDNNLLKQFYVWDTMAMSRPIDQGISVLDVVNLVKGHIKKGYRCKAKGKIKDDDSYYRSQPRFRHQTHCVIFVVDARSVYHGIDEQYKKKIHSIQDQLRREQIPRIFILTKVEQLCEEVEKDFKNLFSSSKVQEAVNMASEVFSVAKVSIHPVKNYEDDYNINTSTNIPLLLALKQAMEYADHRVQHVHNDEECRQ